MKKKLLTGFPIWDSRKQLWRIMKLTILFSLCFVMMVAANSYSQSTKLSLKLTGSTIKDVLNEVEGKSEFIFLYKNGEMNDQLKVNIDVRNATINEILDKILSGQNLSYDVYNRQVIIRKNMDTPEVVSNTVNQQKSVSGKVTDSSGSPLPGVSVVVKGTTTGTITDANGNYSITNVPANATLQFSFVGMKTLEIAVGSKTSINITLTEEAIGIDEVVAIGYGTQKKGTLTSSVSVVKADEIRKATVANVSNTLSGKAAGLIVRNNNAEPGVDASTIYVRGVSTTGNNNALIVVDGIPDRDLNIVDINDIESVTVLKDASAVAPYGSRGANGVILVTTKRGKLGKPTINYTSYYGVSKPTRTPQFASSADYARMYNEAARNEGKPESFSADEISKYEAGNNPNYPNTQWWDELVKPDPIQSQNNLAVSGANENVSYYISLGTFRQDGFFSQTDFKKYNTRANIDAKITKDLKVSFDLYGYSSNKKSPGGNTSDFLEGVAQNIPIIPVRTPDGKFVSGRNPVAANELGGGGLRKSNDFNGSLKFEYNPSYIPGLSFKAIGVYDYMAEHYKVWYTPFTTWRMVDRANGVYEEVPPTIKPSLSERANFSSNKQLEFQMGYKRTVSEKHNIGALLVYNQTEWNSNYLVAGRINYLSSSIDQLFAGPQDGQSTNGSAFEGARKGYVGRLTYDYSGKYMFEGNFRYDGSMKFAPDKRWGFFPSFALGWRLSEESFIKDNFKSIDNLKLRGSWGQAGNDRVGDFQYLASYGAGSFPYSFGGAVVQTFRESRLPNPDITWETATSTNVGLEGSLWKGLLSFETDYFFKRTDNILRPTQKTSSIIGINLPDENIGIVENKGIELTIGHKNEIGEFNYNANFVFTYAKNKAIELSEAIGTLNDPIRRKTGNPLNAYYGLISDGLFTSDSEITEAPKQGGGIKPGDIKYKDINGPKGVADGIIDSYDETKIGYSSIPEIIYGINMGADYKGFDLTLNFQGATRVDYMVGSALANAFDNGGGIQQWQIDERWTSENNNANARYPRITSAPTGNNTKASTYWLRDGSYLRLKTLQIGYNFDRALLSNIKIEGFRIYVSGQNLFTWTKDKLVDFDPEAYHSAGKFYPQAKVYTVGLNLTF
ncbi:MAG: TonB-dependent receptor [Prolixibacteraceae bacterium]|nr:TonB-dependent receptor [Prolixibacteraceae bacterium]